jgi:hypothetical protein
VWRVTVFFFWLERVLTLRFSVAACRMSLAGRWAMMSLSRRCFPTRITGGLIAARESRVWAVLTRGDSTGVAGVIGILTALLRQAEHGGSYKVKVCTLVSGQDIVAC